MLGGGAVEGWVALGSVGGSGGGEDGDGGGPKGGGTRQFGSSSGTLLTAGLERGMGE